jgi:hypothetical protein
MPIDARGNVYVGSSIGRPTLVPEDDDELTGTKERKVGKESRIDMIRKSLDKTGERMKELELKGRELAGRGADEEEFQPLIDKHRVLRDRQRYFNQVLSHVDDEDSYGNSAGTDEQHMAQGEKLQKTSGQSLDELYNAAKEKRNSR